jgi:hypothetical protein
MYHTASARACLRNYAPTNSSPRIVSPPLSQIVPREHTAMKHVSVPLKAPSLPDRRECGQQLNHCAVGHASLFSLHRVFHAVAVFTLWGPIIQDISTSISTRKRLLPPQSAFHDPVPRQAVILRKLILKTRSTEKRKQHCPQMLSPRPSIGARPLIGAWGLSQVTTSVIANKTGQTHILQRCLRLV